MKIKVTRKDVQESLNVYSAGYCDLQYLLYDENAIFYNAGVYGWNWDGYLLDKNTLIVTGYRNLCGKDIPYSIVKKYNEEAHIIVASYDMKHDKKMHLLNALKKDFIKELQAL